MDEGALDFAQPSMFEYENNIKRLDNALLLCYTLVMNDKSNNPVDEKEFLDYLAKQEIGTNLTVIDDLMNGLREDSRHLDRGFVISVFRSLEDGGYGTLLLGRRGKQTRFVWNDSNKETLEFSLEKGGENNERETQDVETITHQFVLRPNFKVTIVLPSDFSGEESERFSAFIKSLPF